MEAYGVIYCLLWTIEIMVGICDLGSRSDEKPVRPHHERPGEANPSLDGGAIPENGTFLASPGKSAHPLWDREVGG